ncbi:ABC transporter permease [Rhizobium leguminosarum]|uniref:ABC transporter permease n=1 Tax=Rhizobium leguminosarum TaxID=384 RepID=UPI001441B4A0|nr:ABC transporter permease [Rhizobium leguminosarum]MBY5904209.1 ABC transporter permease [Rhizobium leguminosarum]MBY5911578.1 ABC transporter permease [Rhizobium leguminosarum]NKK89198.1 ABC transporter permease [Rhizobium leguminosarum bv. viciae]
MTDNVSTSAEAGLKGAATEVAQFATSRGPLKKLQGFLHKHPTSIPLIVLLLGVIVFTLGVGDKFFAPFNLSLILQQVTIIGVLAIAQTLIILTAGIDLSVGAMMVLSAVVMGRLAVVLGFPPELSFLAGLLCGTLCGLINGMFVALLRLPPFIVTLGTWSMFGAMVLYVSRSETIRSQDVAAAAPMLQWLGTRFPIGGGAVLTAGSLLMIVIAICVWYVLTQTAFGRHIYATGDDPEAVRLVGINSKKTLMAVYTIAGFICAIAGWVVIGRIGAVSPLAGANANLDAITAVVIGGTSLFGGRGSIVGSLIGALIVGTFRNGLALWGVEVLWQEFAVGGLIILAVTIDQWIRRISA